MGQQEVLDYVNDNPGAKFDELVAALDKSPQAVSRLLTVLRGKDEIQKFQDDQFTPAQYYLPEQNTTLFYNKSRGEI